MAFAIKKDRCGLTGANDNLLIRDSNRNGSEEKYQPQGTCGDFVAIEPFGEDSAPTCAYALKADATFALGDLALNKITTIEEKPQAGTTPAVIKKYGLESITISTGAASAVKISATSQQLEDDADDSRQNVYLIPVFTLSTKQCAQVLFDAFTLSGAGCKLTQCSATIGCTIGKDKLVGRALSSDCNSGVITVTGTILRLNSVAQNVEPTITAKADPVQLGGDFTGNWVVTKQPVPTETNPETAYQTYTFELQLNLHKIPFSSVAVPVISGFGTGDQADIIGTDQNESYFVGTNLNNITEVRYKLMREGEEGASGTFQILSKSANRMTIDPRIDTQSGSTWEDSTLTFVYGLGNVVKTDVFIGPFE